MAVFIRGAILAMLALALWGYRDTESDLTACRAEAAFTYAERSYLQRYDHFFDCMTERGYEYDDADNTGCGSSYDSSEDACRWKRQHPWS